ARAHGSRPRVAIAGVASAPGDARKPGPAAGAPVLDLADRARLQLRYAETSMSPGCCSIGENEPREFPKLPKSCPGTRRARRGRRAARKLSAGRFEAESSRGR